VGPHVFVDTEHGINAAIRKIRALLKDDAAKPKFIKTVIGLGYRFVAPVHLETPAQSPQRVFGSRAAKLTRLLLAQAPSVLERARLLSSAAVSLGISLVL
jgi:hypothetical protein